MFRSYTALGDSIASGFGAGDILPPCQQGDPIDTAKCTSAHCGKYAGAYAYRFAKDYKIDNFRWPACQGDSIKQVKDDQAPSSGNPALVTIHAGSDDNSLFSDVVTRCTLTKNDPNQQRVCDKSVSDAYYQISQITGRMKELINIIHAADPNTLIAVMGYFSFWHLPGDDGFFPCSLVWNWGGEKNWPVMNQLSAAMNSALKAATNTPNVLWVETDQYFQGHRICDRTIGWWFNSPFQINLPADPLKDFRFHPTIEGQDAIYRALQVALDCARPS